MTQPVPIEPEAATEALCADKATAEAVQSQYDAEHGLPRKCMCADGSEPPPGVPCMLLHCQELTPIVDDNGMPIAWVHSLPRAALPVAVAANVQPKTKTEIAALKAEHQPELPDVVPDVVPGPKAGRP
jgi:hypothetical protein